MIVVRKLLLPLAAAAVLAAPPASAAELPSLVRVGEPTLTQVGKGRLTWLGFGIYQASLWTPSGSFEDFKPGEPVALSLWYERRFSRAQLLEITTGEWERLGLASAEQRAAWARQLDAIWLDMDKGDNMTAVVTPGGATRFYNQDRGIGRIEDPEFGPAFLSIWLDSRSAVKELRGELLGRT